MSKKRIAILASGRGSNAAVLMDHFQGHAMAEVALVLSNRSAAGVLDEARKRQVESRVLSSTEAMSDGLLAVLQEHRVDFVVLAGYLKLIPGSVVEAFPERIVNIHPALLPRHGGKGMYGQRVHEAVLKAGETKSGITIHYVNAAYDEGAILFQATCPVDRDDTADSLAQKIHALEHRHYPQVIETLVTA